MKRLETLRDQGSEETWEVKRGQKRLEKKVVCKSMCICMYIYMYTHRCNICDKYSYPEKCLMMCHEPRDPCLLCSAQMLVGEIR